MHWWRWKFSTVTQRRRAVGANACREDGSGAGAAHDNATALAAAGVDAALAQALSGCQRLSVSDCDAPLLVWSVMLARVEGLANDVRCTALRCHALCVSVPWVWHAGDCCQAVNHSSCSCNEPLSLIG